MPEVNSGRGRKRGRNEENQLKDQEVLRYFKRGGRGTAQALAERFGFDNAQGFRMYTHTLRKFYEQPIFSYKGEYALWGDRSILLRGSVKQYKRGFGYILMGGRLFYDHYLLQANKDAQKLDGADREEVLDEIAAVRGHLDSMQAIIKDMNRRLGAPVVLETGQVQLPLLEAAAT